MSKRSQLHRQIKAAMADIHTFVDSCSGISLRAYQREAAAAIIQSVLERAGRAFVIMFPRQSGKNELQAQIETYLLCCFYVAAAEMVKVSPTWKPQTINAMRRLESVLEKNIIASHLWAKESGYIYRCGSARIYFFSGQPRSNIVGATASVLLEVDEAQDIMIAKYDKDIAPMAASSNATRVFWGTAWTSRTLLARELRAARQAENLDGVRRVFVLTADQVADEVPAYGQYVSDQVARLGRNHPMVKTQYFSEEIDAQGGLFPPERVALMRGAHAPCVSPQPGKIYAAALDLAGEDEAVLAATDGGARAHVQLANPLRDSTALTIFEVDLDSVDDPLVNKPTYRVVFRQEWIGSKHADLYGRIKAMVELWDFRYIVVDATGVGAGMASFLSAACGEPVICFEFNTHTKSDMLWDFLGIIDSGRYKDYDPAARFSTSEAPSSALTKSENFWTQVSFCEFEILSGPQKRVRWGVPDGTRDPASGELVHDDLMISAAMLAILDRQNWSVSAPTFIIQADDPLNDLDRGF